MSLFLNRNNGFFSIQRFSNEWTFAKIDYNNSNQKYSLHYTSFKTPKIPIKYLEVSTFSRKESSTNTIMDGGIEINLATTPKEQRLTFKLDNPIASFEFYPSTKQEYIIETLINFLYMFNNVEDVIEICRTSHPNTYSDSISLSQKISSIASILNKLDKESMGASKLIKWLKDAFLRFEILLKPDDGKGEQTQFSTLDPILSKHGYALYNME